MALKSRLLDIVFDRLGLDGRVERDHELAEDVVGRLLAEVDREAVKAQAAALEAAADALVAAPNECPHCLHAEPIVVEWLRARAKALGKPKTGHHLGEGA